MAKSNKPKVTKSTDSKPIIIEQITVGQVVRGNQTIQTWISNLKSAESNIAPNRRGLLNTYFDIDIDPRLTSLREKRILALQTIPFEWPTVTDEAVKENLSSPWFFEMLGIIGGFIFEGYTVMEFKLENGMIVDVEEIPRQNVIPHKKVITRNGWGDTNGAFPYTEPPYNNYVLEVGKPKNLGLYAKLAPYVLMKRDNMGDWARFNEMFGMPLRWYEYDPNDPTARQKVTESAQTQGSAAYVVVPKGTMVNFVDSSKTGQANYEPLHNALNEEMAIMVLGQTLTTSQTKVGSNALGKVHQQVESEIAMRDRIFTEYLINYKFKNNILIPHGYPIKPEDKGSFTLTEEISQEKKLEMWIKLIAAGLPIAKEDFYNEFGIPFPEDRETVQPPASPAPDPETDPDPKDPDDPDGGEDDDPKLSSPGSPLEGGKGGVSAAVAKLYASTCKHRPAHKSIQLSFTEDLSAIIDDLIRKLFERQDVTNVAAQLSALTEAELARAVNEGFGAITAAADQNMINALLADVKVFSGFKTEAFLKEATALLVDQNNSVRPFAAFRDEVLKLNNRYNVAFLQAEYNHAIGTSRMASKWLNIVAKKETLPLLQYLTAGDARVRQSHRPLDKIILPMDHPFWDTHMPPNDWNCRCNVRQLADGEQTILAQENLPQIKEEFRFNPGKSKTVFPKSHPYYQQPPEE